MGATASWRSSSARWCASSTTTRSSGAAAAAAGELLVPAQRLERDDGVRRAGEGRLRAAELGDPLGREEREEGVELVEELREPLEREVLGDDDEDALRDAELAQPGEDEARLDGLPEPDLVGEDEARHAVGEDAPGGADLVREDVDARGEERAERVGAAERLEPEDARAQREGAPPGRRSPAASASSGPPAARSIGVSAGTSASAGSRPETTVMPVAAGEADGDAAALVSDLDDDADAPAALGAVHDLHPGLPRHPGAITIRHRGRSSEPFRPRDGALGRRGAPPGLAVDTRCAPS